MPVRLSYRRKIAFSLATTTLFFLLVEAWLVLAGVQQQPAAADPFVELAPGGPLFVEAADAQTPANESPGTATATGEQTYLETAPPKLAFFNRQQFPATKADGTVRIFCLGGSTTFGRPYDDRTSFAGWLRELLPQVSADSPWEVINAGGISYASYRVAATMEELCAYEPDLFIVYTGHNEFLEARTYRSAVRRPAVVRGLTALLSRTRTYAAAEAFLGRHALSRKQPDRLAGEVDAILDHAAGPDTYQRDDEHRDQILEHFAFNLSRMIGLAHNAGAKIIFVQPASNLKDFSPFKSQFGDHVRAVDRDRCTQLLSAALTAQQQGQPAAALDLLIQAREIDDRLATIHFRIGRVLWAQGDTAAARPAFLRAVEEDVCALRATPDMQRMIEQIADEAHVPLVDLDALLRADCRDRFQHDSPGSEYFLDHVHPRIEVHRLLAVALVETLRREGWITPGSSWPSPALELATERIESTVDDELQSRALTNLAQVLSWAGKQDVAGPLAAAAVRLRSAHGLADDVESLFYAAVHFATTGANDQAIDLLKRVIAHDPQHSGARWRLATLLYDQGRIEEAETHFRAAVQLDPSDADSHHMLGVIAMRLEKFKEAVASFRLAARIDSTHAATCIKLAAALEAVGDVQEAVAWYRQAIQVDGQTVEARRRLGKLLLRQGRGAEALQQFQAAHDMDPQLPGIRADLQQAREAVPAGSKESSASSAGP